jgi:hypothetical protein
MNPDPTHTTQFRRIRHEVKAIARAFKDLTPLGRSVRGDDVALSSSEDGTFRPDSFYLHHE